MGYIYKITNLKNGKVYIGQTSQTIAQRWCKHKSLARMNNSDRHLYKAMNYYGIENFIIEEIEECDNSLLDEREIYWIKFFKSLDKNYGYNMTPGGKKYNVWKYIENKKEASKKLSKSNKGKHKMSSDHLKKLLELAKEVNTIKIDENEMLKDILSFKSVEEICKKYNLSRRTFYNKCQQFYGKTPTELRGDRLTHTNTSYKELNKTELYKLILEGKKLIEIADYFNVSKETIHRRIKDYFNSTLKEMKKNVK